MRRLSLIAAILFVIAANDAAAQKEASNVKQAIQGLKSASPDEVLDSIQTLAAAGAAQAVDPLITLLHSGPRADVTNAVLQCLGMIGHAKAVDTLIEFLNHRRSDARVTAIYALESFKSEKVARALEDALRDADAQVRATASLALGKHGTAQSVGVLFKAFDKGVTDAAISIGQLGSPEDADRLSRYLGKADIKMLLPGFDEFLRRPAFPEKAKLQILDKLFELAGPEVRRFALAYKASFPPNTDANKNELYKTVSRMVRQIQGD